MISLTLSEEQCLLQKTARDFAEKEIRPLAARIARDESLQRDSWQHCKGIFDKGAELGFTNLLLPECYGGLGLACIDNVIVLEELGAADVGIAADFFNLNATIPLLINVGGSEVQKGKWLREFCERPAMLSGALSEPNVAGSELFCPSTDPALGIKTHARRDGEDYVLSGSKSAFITNAGVAEFYFIMARTDLSKPMMESTSIFLVPANSPGLTVGLKTEMIGLKTTHHAEVFLDDVRVPVANLIGGEGRAMPIFMQVPQMAIGLAACYVGLARAAYDYALTYARERKSWGQPIASHQAVALKLADMYADVQAARLMVWDAALAADSNPMEASMLKGPAAKTQAVDAAIRNAQRAVEILGGYGVTREYEAGRYLNDAWVGYACDFTRDMLRMGMAHALQATQ